MMTALNSSICQHFKLSYLPFLERSKTCFEHEQFRDNIDLLSSAFMSRQILCITGAAGTGKSSLIFYAVNELEPSQFRVASIELSNPIFDELRSFYDEGHNFSLVLSGLPSLKNQLNIGVNQPLKQRIFVFLDCTGLSLNETKEYVTNQLTLAGARVPIFDEKCFPFIHSVTSGAERRINQLCYGGLITALKTRESIISEDTLKKIHEKLSYQV